MRSHRAILALLALAAAGCGDGAAATGSDRARVQRVTDGDTVVLSGVGKARLIGVDTPEVFGGAECYGREASAFAKRLLPEGARVRYRFGAERRDRYGRALVYLYRGDTMVNAELVRRGYAVPLTIPPNVEHAERFRRLAREARQEERGLWAERSCAGDADRPARGRAGRERGGASRGGDRDCADFATQVQAQRYFEARGGPASDPDRLDGDGNGTACDALP